MDVEVKTRGVKRKAPYSVPDTIVGQASQAEADYITSFFRDKKLQKMLGEHQTVDDDDDDEDDDDDDDDDDEDDEEGILLKSKIIQKLKKIAVVILKVEQFGFQNWLISPNFAWGRHLNV